MTFGSELLLVAAVAGVGVLHTIVPDHWVPITLIARQRGWSKSETARASLQAGTGHVLSTLLIALVVWLAGVAVAERFGRIVDTASGIALIAFGGWIAISSWRELRSQGGHGRSHRHDFPHLHEPDDQNSIHGPALQRIPTEEGIIELSIFESDVLPRFRLSNVSANTITVQTRREGGELYDFMLANHGTHWESVEEIPEPHQFGVSVLINRNGDPHRYETEFTEYGHGHHGHGHHHDHDHETAPEDDPLYAPLVGETAVLTRHVHAHRHGRGSAHVHWHDHIPASSHQITAEIETAPPAHEHRHKTTAHTALLLILGSSPMVEGIPAFFAAGKYGFGLIVVMAIVFALSTIATYVVLCVSSTAGLQRVRLGVFERYGEVLSGAFIVLVGLAFSIWPVI